MDVEMIPSAGLEDQHDDKDDSGIEQDNSWLYIRIAVEDHNLQKVLKLNLDDTVWNAKQKVLQVLLRELVDGLNFGLYLPPCNGRAGKFLDESRYLREYPLSGPVAYLELKYKRRVYKAIHLVQKSINTKVSVKRFVDWIKTNQTSKVARYLDKGFDPNFHISNDDTPLSCACVDLLEPRSMLMTLINGGAHLDFRTRHGGLTPLHKSAMHFRKESIVTLLELGASPNVYDEKGLTPLYHCILNKQSEFINDSSYCCQLLLQDHSIVNCRDDYLSTELHQACRLGLVQHIEHLLFYRADINAVNLAGNTPLHVCAATNQEACARVLLFRGADVTMVNKSNQNAYELALISQNSSVASIIQCHKSDHVVPFRETPLINPKRRSIYVEQEKHRRRSSSLAGTPLSLSNRSQSMPKLNGVNLLNTAAARNDSPSNEHPFHQHPSSRSSSPKSFSVHSDHGFGSECASHLSSASPNAMHTCYTYKRKRLYAAAPGRKCMCIKSYRGNLQGELPLDKGDIVEILSVGEQGFLEGKCKDIEGWFPSNHVQDIRIFKNGEMTTDDTIVISRDALSALMINSDSYAPRTVVLQRGKKGFGFVLRGCRVAGKLFQPTASFPALQFLDSIEKSSNADRAGLKQNDYVLEINGINVISTPHEECVQLIKRAGNTLALKVITANTVTSSQCQQRYPSHAENITSQSLPYRRKEDLDRTLAEYEYGSLIVPSTHISSDLHSTSKPINEIITNGSASLRSRNKPVVPERDSSLYDSLTNSQNQQVYQTFRPLHRESLSAVSVPNLLGLTNGRCHSNSSSNEADEELSMSSLNSNQVVPPTFQGTEENGVGIYMTPSLSLSTSNMSTFKTSTTTISSQLPSKPSEVKRRSNNRKQTYAAPQCNHNSNNNNNNNNNNWEIPTANNTSGPPPPPPLPPPPPPLPANFDSMKKSDHRSTLPTENPSITTTTTTEFQRQIEIAKARLKRASAEEVATNKESAVRSKDGIKSSQAHHPGHPSRSVRSPCAYDSIGVKNMIIEERTPPIGFPPPPSPSTLHRSTTTTTTTALSSDGNSSVGDPRCDSNFSSVIAQRAAAAKARRHENLSGFESNSNGLPPSTTFFNNCVTTNRISTHLISNGTSSPQRFSASANQLLENLKRRSGNPSLSEFLVSQ